MSEGSKNEPYQSPKHCNNGTNLLPFMESYNKKKTKVPRARYANVLLLSYLILNNMKYGGGGNWFFLFIVQVI